MPAAACSVTNLGAHVYQWDGAGRLTKFDHSSGTSNDAVYAYLPGSWARYKRAQGGVTEYYVYDGDNVVGSYAANGSLNDRYITPGLDANVSMTRGGSTYYYMADGLGSVRNVIDSSEVVQNTYDYYAFGNTLTASPADVANPYRYTGREYESGGVLDTYYYRNRYYVAQLGIFMSRDAFWADEARGWTYVHQDPVGKTDAFGLFDPVSIGGAAVAAGGVVAGALDIYYAVGTGLAYKDAWEKDCDYCRDLSKACSPRYQVTGFPVTGLDRLCLAAFAPGGECAGIGAGAAGLAAWIVSKTPGTTITGPAADPPTGPQ